MKPSTILFIAVNYLGLASAASIANRDDSLHTMEKRKCFSTGENFGGDRQAALNAAKQACEGPLKGKYQKRETAVKCYNIADKKHVIFTIGLSGPNAGSTRTLGSDECYNGLASEINSCGKGGDTTYGNWRYRADVNANRC
ncbi:hypothetical protein GQ44DRAFT_665948 [Phaeosphaeriaceae sp. PMI808]|nr:hypothetical protein GQ44DRAFT_665948 [Phaeosphaeriaceae sp. PMI808]